MPSRTMSGLALVALLVFGLGIVTPGLVMGGEAASQVIGKTLTAVMKQITRSSPPPEAANKEAIAAEISLSYPEFVDTAASAGVAAINKAVQERMLRVGTEPDAAAFGSAEDLMKSFFADYEKTMKENPDMPGAWSLKFEAVLRHADDELISLDFMESVFSGGAHPNSNIAYQVFSLKTGQPLELSAFVPADKLGELTAIAERHFRKIRNLKPDETYQAAGFLFEDNKFTLNDNFLVSKDGLAFYYNPYEIAPYGMGNTELVIPWADLKGLADPKGPAGRFL